MKHFLGLAFHTFLWLLETSYLNTCFFLQIQEAVLYVSEFSSLCNGLGGGTDSRK